MKPKTTAKSNLKSRNRNGRPALPEDEKQSIVRHTRYSPPEDARLLENVRLSGFPYVSEYIRRVSLNPKMRLSNKFRRPLFVCGYLKK